MSTYLAGRTEPSTDAFAVVPLPLPLPLPLESRKFSSALKRRVLFETIAVLLSESIHLHMHCLRLKSDLAPTAGYPSTQKNLVVSEVYKGDVSRAITCYLSTVFSRWAELGVVWEHGWGIGHDEHSWTCSL